MTSAAHESSLRAPPWVALPRTGTSGQFRLVTSPTSPCAQKITPPRTGRKETMEECTTEHARSGQHSQLTSSHLHVQNIFVRICTEPNVSLLRPTDDDCYLVCTGTPRISCDNVYPSPLARTMHAGSARTVFLMQLDQVLASLGYNQSANYLRGKALETDRDFGHVFRKAQEECNLHGAYVLNGTTFEKSRGSVPTVFVCQANTEQEAREIHRKVWNQNAVPFLLVISTGWIRLYPGFQYERDVSRGPAGGSPTCTPRLPQRHVATRPDSGVRNRQRRRLARTRTCRYPRPSRRLATPQ